MSESLVGGEGHVLLLLFLRKRYTTAHIVQRRGPFEKKSFVCSLFPCRLEEAEKGCENRRRGEEREPPFGRWHSRQKAPSTKRVRHSSFSSHPSPPLPPLFLFLLLLLFLLSSLFLPLLLLLLLSPQVWHARDATMLGYDMIWKRRPFSLKRETEKRVLLSPSICENCKFKESSFYLFTTKLEIFFLSRTVPYFK